MIGKSLGHYEIVEKIGVGGMGEVYRAKDTRLDREIALKILPKKVAADPERQARFVREAKAIARLKHPNIVTIYSVEEADGLHFLTMELVEGGTLGTVLEGRDLPLARFFDLAIPLVDAICSAHSEGIAHRDLKPANIMLDAAGRVKVLDFGLAKLMDTATEADDATVQIPGDVTEDGRILGTVNYMSPEQAEGKPIDQRSDVFSLGILLYQMATGRRPFEGETRISTMSAILKDNPENVVELNTALPRHLGRIIHRCLAKEPERRYQSAIDLRNDLESLRSELNSDDSTVATATRAKVSTARESRPFLSPRALVPVILVATVAVIAWFALQRGANDERAPAETMLDFNAIAVLYFENLSDPDDSNRLGRIAASLLTPALSTSSELTMISEQRLFDVLRKLQKEDAVIDRTVASEVAREAGAGRVILGQVSMLGQRLSLTSQVVDMQSGAILSSHRAEGVGEESLFGLVDELARGIVADLLGSHTALREPTSVATLTTRSVDAYRHYQEGLTQFREHRFSEANSSFDAAVAEDSDFAMAHFYRSRPFWPYWTEDREEISLVRARHFSDRVPPSERALIEAAALWKIDENTDGAIELLESAEGQFPDDHRIPYLRGRIHFFSTGKLDSATDALEKARRLNPDDTYTLNALGYAYADQGRMMEAHQTMEHYVSLEPENPNARDSLAEIQLRSGDLEGALATYNEALAIEPGFFSLAHAGFVPWMQGEFPRSIEVWMEGAQNPEEYVRYVSNFQLAMTYQFMGRHQDAQDAVVAGTDAAIVMGDEETAVLMCGVGAVIRTSTASPSGRHCAILETSELPAADLVRQLAGAQRAIRSSDFDQAVAHVERALVPEDRANYLAFVNSLENAKLLFRVAALAGQDRVDEAIELRKPHLPLQDTNWSPNDYGQTFLLSLPLERDAIAQALARAGRLAESIAEYERLLNPDRAAGQYYPVLPIYHYRVGVLYERADDPGSAAEHYQVFLRDWANADPEHPEPNDARERLARVSP